MCRSYCVAGKLALSLVFFFYLISLSLSLSPVSYRPLSEDEARLHTPVVISCNEHRREVAATQSIAGKHIDRHFAFDKVAADFLESCFLILCLSHLLS